MNLKVEMILMVIVAFLIGWFLRTMMSGSSIGSGSRVKAVGGKHEYRWGFENNYEENAIFTKTECSNLIKIFEDNDHFKYLRRAYKRPRTKDGELLGNCIIDGNMIYRDQYPDLDQE